MYKIISNLLFKVVKPIAAISMKRRGYPQEAIDRKSGLIPEVGFTPEDKTIMFHAVSVGETVAIENLVKAARKKLPEAKIVVTTGTYTGQEVAHKKLGETADLITYFPADFPCAIEKFLDKINPTKVLIAETEIWPNFAMECKKRGIELYIINGRISDRTFKSYKAFRWLFKYFLSFYTGIYTQSEEDNQKFAALGAKPQRMGNLKFDILKPEGTGVNSNGYRILLAGSTHSGEDEIVLNVFKKLKEKHSDLKLILAPRHLTRMDEIKPLLKDFNYDMRSNGKNDFEGIDILVLDTMGELGKTYSISDISFIGGSFNTTGGHNPLESIVFEKPVISGPSIHNFKDIYSIITKAHAGFVVKTEKEFFETADKMLTDKEFYAQTTENCKKVFQEQQGALEFVLDNLLC